MSDRYFDRQGAPMQMMAWAKSSGTLEDKRVAEDTIGDCWVSTVWIGLDHQFGEGPPLIFETMVFPVAEGIRNYSDLYCERYSTEAEAKAGHEAVVARLREHGRSGL